jgi:SAM-dependent methyltransferase
MRLPLSRTRATLLHRAKEIAFDYGGFQQMLDLRDLHKLEDSMGFRGQFYPHRAFQFEILKRYGLERDHSFLELGCGPLTAGIPIIDYLDPGKYMGVDIRESVLNLAWMEIGKAGLSAKNPRLIRSLSFANDELGTSTFDFIYSFSVLFHLSNELIDLYFQTLDRRLAPSGKCVANVNTTIPTDKWLEFPFVKRSIDDYASIAMKYGLKATNVGPINTLGFNGGIEGDNPLLIFERDRSASRA